MCSGSGRRWKTLEGMTVQELLQSKGIEYLAKGKDYLVRCLNPEHDDSNPSMRIDRTTGIYNCFSCGYKGNIFSLYGEKVGQLQLRRELLKRKIGEKRADSVGLSFPTSYTPYIGDWRGIRPETYKMFEAFQHHDKEHIGRIVFPIRDLTGRIVAFNGRHTTNGIPKYYISPPKAKLPFYPSYCVPILGTCILVEGLFDMLNLHDKGLTNAVCSFGTKNVSKDKLGIMKLRGIYRVDIFFDGDEAGQKAAAEVKVLAEEVGLYTRNINLDGRDPGDLSLEQVHKLGKQLYNYV